VNENLPIHRYRDEIVRMARKHSIIVVVGETGSGKTTCVPRFLYEAEFCNLGRIAVTEPRRIAATSVSAFVAEQMSVPLGGLVGYRIRHEKRMSEDTRLAYMTEGVLLRELLGDRLLSKYDVLVLDEVHERGLYQDLLMSQVKLLTKLRPELTVVIMSATINEKKFSEYFDNAPVVHVEGRMFPVDIEYRPDFGDDNVPAAVRATEEMLRRTTGDILVFQPDYASIGDTVDALRNLTHDVDILPLYGNQAPEEQLAVFNRKRRSVIVATNIAETSVTLDGVTVVIDTGLIKEMRYFPKTSTSSLQVTEHSKAGCNQRAGRAGRTAPGICVRLYSEKDFESRRMFTQPEILRMNLDGAYLQLRAMGFGDREVRDIDYMDSPSGALWANARETLTAIGAFDDSGDLTETGEQ
jgi:HrpA-like RNA helicase